jgi:CO/xanthine dehydrogenase FAD-binding subunit
MPITVKTCATLGEAASALAASRSARYLGGGTIVMRDVNEGDLSIDTIVRVDDRTLAEVRGSGARITVGAGVTMAQVIANRDLIFLHPVARLVGGPAVRTMATVGGNLFAASPYGDFAAALLALEATVAVQGSFGARETPLEEFLNGRDRNPGVVASVTFTRPATADAFRFRKFSRVRPKGISVLSIAAHLPMSGGRVTGARIAYGAMAPTPIRAKAVERALEGRSLDEAGIAAAVAAAAEGTNPATDAIASAWYRREMVAVHLKRLLLSNEARS